MAIVAGSRGGRWRVADPLACPHCGCELPQPRQRSTRANRYWFGRVVKAFQEHWSKGRTAAGLPPYTKEQVHDTLVRVFVGEEEGPLGDKVAKATKIMDSREFWELTEKARHYALHEYQLYIPEPNQAPDEVYA